MMNLTSSKNRLVLKDRLFAVLHFAFKLLLPIFAFLIIVFLELPLLAYILILLSKWRILSVKPRFWWSNLQINATDLIFSLSVIYFMSFPQLELYQQLIWLFAYFVWILGFRSRSLQSKHLLQGLIAQGLGVSALIYSIDQASLPLILFGIWLVSVLAARHILNGLPKETRYESLIHIWGLFSIQLAWVLLHWQVNFWVLPHLVFLQSVILSAFSLLYFLHHNNSLPVFLYRQVITSVLIITIAVLFLTSFHAVSI